VAEAIVVAGTDTGVGKTVFASMLTLALDAAYWKPVQSGTDGETDTEAVRRLTGLPGDRFLPEAYRLSQPLSPHASADIDGVRLDASRLELPAHPGPLVVELAGGLLVPLRRDLLQIDVVGRWRAPVVLCARTALGTINHTLLSIEALRARAIPLLGVAFIGEARPDTESVIASLGRVRALGRLPRLEPLDASTLRAAFAAGFRREEFSAKVTA
jgi:dethiobiotin synthetase